MFTNTATATTIAIHDEETKTTYGFTIRTKDTRTLPVIIQGFADKLYPRISGDVFPYKELSKISNPNADQLYPAFFD